MLYPTIFPPKNEPGLVLNLFLNFGKNPGSSSYKLGSYKKKRVVDDSSLAVHFLVVFFFSRGYWKMKPIGCL